MQRQQQRRHLFSQRPLAGEEPEVEGFGGMTEGEARYRWLTTT